MPAKLNKLESVYNWRPYLWNIYIYIYIKQRFANFASFSSLPSRLGLYNTPTASLQRGKTTP